MMFFGMHLYGVVSQIPGMLHVATRFFHVNYFPILPVGSVLVVNASLNGGEELVINFGWSAKSLAFAWLRFFLMFAVILFGVSIIPAFTHPAGPNWSSAMSRIASAAALFFVWWHSHRWTRATIDEAQRLCDAAGFHEEFRAMVLLAVDPRGESHSLEHESSEVHQPFADEERREDDRLTLREE